ncbi:hypothetical protein D9M73_161560 [compost metagenome]
MARPPDRRHTSFHLVGKAGEVVIDFGQVAHLRLHLDQQLAVVVHLDFGQPLGVARQQVANLAQQRPARARRQVAPRASQRSMGRADGGVGVGAIATWNARPGIPGPRMNALQRAPV